MTDYLPTDRTRLRRKPGRGSYERATVHAILDAARICHVGFAVGGQPFVLPTALGRDGDTLYLHGAASARMARTLASGVPVCVTVTHLDGVVLARSWMHHSFNYRSVVVLGTARLIEEPERKLHALRCIVEHVAKGRADASRAPSALELRATSVLELAIEEVSAKQREGGPVDDAADLGLDVWAGVIPLALTEAAPIPDAG